MTPTRILLADDYPLIRAGIRATLSNKAEFQVDGEASDGLEMQQLCQQMQPDIIFTIRMGIIPGLRKYGCLYRCS